ncbi:hypothetical protein M427DRAFT_153607 [Gonapodya prolifera JEL478]|uniref:Uncharacterized protein n=1 Tax=Gonapodya prolifera (strain JEL478) TaxID=1344416 RepID=A0A139ALQ2_GONPJ|nr:hypothetical protein M427DRAFT_153607 [Gonapodya prolifera JEL478]|eukprot:KXS17712.1 hypothetical protein M427DRAFT_153607 [Gonapodya prolifera JEL478]
MFRPSSTGSGPPSGNIGAGRGASGNSGSAPTSGDGTAVGMGQNGQFPTQAFAGSLQPGFHMPYTYSVSLPVPSSSTMASIAPHMGHQFQHWPNPATDPNFGRLQPMSPGGYPMPGPPPLISTSGPTVASVDVSTTRATPAESSPENVQIPNSTEHDQHNAMTQQGSASSVSSVTGLQSFQASNAFHQHSQLLPHQSAVTTQGGQTMVSVLPIPQHISLQNSAPTQTQSQVISRLQAGVLALQGRSQPSGSYPQHQHSMPQQFQGQNRPNGMPHPTFSGLPHMDNHGDAALNLLALHGSATVQPTNVPHLVHQPQRGPSLPNQQQVVGGSYFPPSPQMRPPGPGQTMSMSSPTAFSVGDSPSSTSPATPHFPSSTILNPHQGVYFQGPQSLPLQAPLGPQTSYAGYKNWSQAAIAATLQRHHQQSQLQLGSNQSAPAQQTHTQRGSHRASGSNGTNAPTSGRSASHSKSQSMSSTNRFQRSEIVVEVPVPPVNMVPATNARTNKSTVAAQSKPSTSAVKRTGRAVGKSGGTKANDAKTRSKSSVQQPREPYIKPTRAAANLAQEASKITPAYHIIAEYSEDSDSDDETDIGNEGSSKSGGMLLDGLRAAQEAKAKELGVRSPRRIGLSQVEKDGISPNKGEAADSDWSSDEEDHQSTQASIRDPHRASLQDETNVNETNTGNPESDTEARQRETEVREASASLASGARPTQLEEGDGDEDVLRGEESPKPVSDTKEPTATLELGIGAIELATMKLPIDSSVELSDKVPSQISLEPDFTAGIQMNEEQVTTPGETASVPIASIPDTLSESFAPKPSSLSNVPPSGIEIDESESEAEVLDDEEEPPVVSTTQSFAFGEGMGYGDYEELDDDDEEEELEIEGTAAGTLESEAAPSPGFSQSAPVVGAHWVIGSAQSYQSGEFGQFNSEYEYDGEDGDGEDDHEAERIIVDDEATPVPDLGHHSGTIPPPVDEHDQDRIFVEIADGYGVAYMRFPVEKLEETTDFSALFDEWSRKSKETWGTPASTRVSDGTKPKRKNRWVGVARTRESTRTKSRQHAGDSHETDGSLPVPTLTARPYPFCRRRPAVINRKDSTGTGGWVALHEPTGVSTRLEPSNVELISARRKRRSDLRDEEHGPLGNVAPVSKRPKFGHSSGEVSVEADSGRKASRHHITKSIDRGKDVGKSVLKLGTKSIRATVEQGHTTSSPPPKKAKTAQRAKKASSFTIDIDGDPHSRATAPNVSNSGFARAHTRVLTWSHPFHQSISQLQPPLRLVDFGGQGNSLFRCLAFKTVGSAEAHRSVRRQIVEFLKQQTRTAESQTEIGEPPSAWWGTLSDRIARDSDDSSHQGAVRISLKGVEGSMSGSPIVGQSRRSMTASRLLANYLGRMSKDGVEGDITCIEAFAVLSGRTILLSNWNPENSRVDSILFGPESLDPKLTSEVSPAKVPSEPISVGAPSLNSALDPHPIYHVDATPEAAPQLVRISEHAEPKTDHGGMQTKSGELETPASNPVVNEDADELHASAQDAPPFPALSSLHEGGAIKSAGELTGQQQSDPPESEPLGLVGPTLPIVPEGPLAANPHLRHFHDNSIIHIATLPTTDVEERVNHYVCVEKETLGSKVDTQQHVRLKLTFGKVGSLSMPTAVENRAMSFE